MYLTWYRITFRILTTHTLRLASVLVFLVFSALPRLQAGDHQHTWTLGKILDANGVLPYASILSKPSPVQASAAMTTGSAMSAAGAAGTPAGTLIIEGDDLLYVTAESSQWLWTKGVHIPVGGAIEYYVQDNTLHLLDGADKEHSIPIVRLIRRIRPAETVAAATPNRPQPPVSAAVEAHADTHPVPDTSETAAEIRKAAAMASTAAALPAVQHPVAVTTAANPSLPAPSPAQPAMKTPKPAATAQVAVATPPTAAPAIAAPAIAVSAAAHPIVAAPAAVTHPVSPVVTTGSVAPKSAAAEAPPTDVVQVNLPLTPAVPPPASAPTINVDSTPAGAAVEIDHEPAGTTPLSHYLSKGFHDVTISKDGFQDWHKTIVMSETELRLSADLQQTGSSQ